MEEENIKEYKELDRKTYIDQFVDGFLIAFPNVYTKEELLKIMDEQVKHIYVTDIINNDKTRKGQFNKADKIITLTKEDFNNTTIHEFIHALVWYKTTLGTSVNEINYELMGIDEAFTELATILYSMSNKEGEPVKSFGTTEKNIHSFPKYAQSLCKLYSYISPDDSLIHEYLKGENIAVYIRKIFAKFYESLIPEDAKIEDYWREIYRSAYNELLLFSELYRATHEEGHDKSEVEGISKEIEKVHLNLYFNLSNKCFGFMDASEHDPNFDNDLMYLSASKERFERFMKMVFDSDFPTYTLDDEIDYISSTIIKRDNGYQR